MNPGMKVVIAVVALTALACAWNRERLLSLVLWVVLVWVLVFQAGCASQGRLIAEVKSGINVARGGGFAGPQETFIGSLRYEFGDRYRYACELTDISHVSAGAPFNSRGEDYIHFAGCSVRVTLWGH